MPVRPLLAALACVAVACLTWAVAFRTGLGHSADVRVLNELALLQETRWEYAAVAFGYLCNPIPYALLCGMVLLLGLRTRGVVTAVVLGGILVIPNVLTQVLKHALAEERTGGGTLRTHVEAVSWPSGHSTAAMALALCLVIAAPAGWRGVAAVAGGLFALAMALTVVALGWHFPSDTIGGFAVAGAGAGLGLTLLGTRAALPSRSLPARG